MRIAGGVLLLLIGVFSLAEGGCVSMLCVAGSEIAGGVKSGLGEIAKSGGKNLNEADVKRAIEKSAGGLTKLAQNANAIRYISYLIRLAGLLCLVAGILFFVNKGKMFGFLAPGVGIIAEIALIAMAAFTFVGLVKILIYAFGLIAATKVGQPASA